MATGDKPNSNLFGTDYNAGEEERKRLEEEASLAAQSAMMGAGNIPSSAFGQAPEVSPFSMQAAGQVNPMMQQQSLEVTPQAPNPVTFLPYADDVAPPPASALSVFTPGGEVKPNVDVNAITPSPEMTSPSSVNTALNQGVLIGNAQKNGRAITMSDVNDPSFEGMSASEISQAINDPNYLTTGPTIPNVANVNKQQSRFGKGLDAVVDLGTKNLFSNIDTGLNVYETLSSPFLATGNYLLNPNEPSFSEAYQQVGDFIPDSPLSRAINPEINAEEMESKQQQLVKNFLADQATEKTTQEAQGQQGTPNVNQVLQDGIGSFQPGAIDFSKPPTMPDAPNQSPELEIRQGEEGSPQGYFNAIINERPLTPEEIKLGKAFADRKGFDFNPQTGFSSITDPGSKTFDTPTTFENYQARGLDVGQFMRGEDDPSQRTEYFVSPQGMRRRFTAEAARAQGLSEEDIAQNRPLAPKFAAAEAAGDQMIADLRAREAAKARGREGPSMRDYRYMVAANEPGATRADKARGRKAAADNNLDFRTGLPLETTGGLSETERLNREKFELEQTKFIQSMIDTANTKAPLSPAQKKFAEEAGKGAYSWDQGGRQTSEENIGKFGQIIQDLEQGQLDTRTLSEFVPFGGDWWRSALNPTGQQGLDNVRGVIFQGLRDTLGAQFTEKEGERLVNAAYNPKLSEEQNIARLKPALARMKATFQAKEALTRHIIDGGDIREYKGKTPMDVYKSFDGQAGSGSPIPGDVDVDVQSNAQAILDRQ